MKLFYDFTKECKYFESSQFHLLDEFLLLLSNFLYLTFSYYEDFFLNFLKLLKLKRL